MNTPNLDTLIEQAANADRRTYEGARIRTRFARLFATHGPAMVAELKHCVDILEGMYTGKYPPVARAKKILVQLDQEATCQK